MGQARRAGLPGGDHAPDLLLVEHAYLGAPVRDTAVSAVGREFSSGGCDAKRAGTPAVATPPHAQAGAAKRSAGRGVATLWGQKGGGVE